MTNFCFIDGDDVANSLDIDMMHCPKAMYIKTINYQIYFN